MNFLKTLVSKIFKNKNENPIKKNEISNENEVSIAKQKKNIKYILSLDGGGTKGFIELVIMSKIEEIATQIAGKKITISDCFDIICGTSVGSIFACLIGIDKSVDANKLNTFFIQNLQNIFTENSEKKASFLNKLVKILDNKYSDEGRRKVFELFFSNKKFSQLQQDCVCTAYNMDKKKIQLFSPYSTPNCTILDALMASTAAPTYFSNYKIEMDSKVMLFTDGGVGANNPSLYAYKYAKEKYSNENVDEYRIISLGSYKNPVNLSGISSKKDWIDWNKNGYMPIQKIYSLTQDELINESCRCIDNLKYLRIVNKKNEFRDYISTDSKSLTDIEKLKNIGKSIAENYREQIEEFIKERF